MTSFGGARGQGYGAGGSCSAEGAPVWAYPFLVLAPIAGLFVGHFQQGAYLLFFIAIGMRWAWMLLQPHGIRISGPETLGDVRIQSGERENPQNYK